MLLLGLVSRSCKADEAEDDRSNIMRRHLNEIEEVLRLRDDCKVLFRAFDQIGQTDFMRSAIYRAIRPIRAVVKELVRIYQESSSKMLPLRYTFNKLFDKHIAQPCKIVTRTYLEQVKEHTEEYGPVKMCEIMMGSNSKKEAYRSFRINHYSFAQVD